jgi:DNA polymerase delta subunit 2
MTSAEKLVRKTSVLPGKPDTTFQNPSTTRSYHSQFNSLYAFRSNELKSRIMKLATPKWSTANINGTQPKFISKVLDVPFLKPVFVIGTTLADMKYKPNVLKEVELSVQGHFKELKELTEGADNSHNKIDDLRKSSYSDPKTDKLWLEDESGRILLTGDLLNEKILVTGLVIGVLGMEIESGVFHVVDIVYPEAAPQLPIKADLNVPGKLLLTSGLNMSEESSLQKYELLSNWIMGDLGDERAIDVNELIVVGNSIDINTSKPKVVSEKDKYSEVFNSQYSEQPVKFLDSFFNELLQSIPISILPGPKDIVETGLPKQPIHKSLFKKSSNRVNFKRMTDPLFYEINGLRILITSGENINDIMKYILPNNKIEEEISESVYTDSRLRIIEDSLLWQIIAPTAPDTLCCYPFDERDPFTLLETPHVYIVGNQPRYETSMIELKRKNGAILPVRVIALPEFSETNACVLLDLQSLNCELVKFSC